MRLLLNERVWKPAKTLRQGIGFDVISISDLSGMEDREVLQLAHEQPRILVTLDNDFGRVSVLENQPHFGIIRLVDIHALEQTELITEILRLYGEELTRGGLVVAGAKRIRLRSR